MSDINNDSNKSVNCILVTPLGRSGSIFFQSLFDGHPQVITLPTFSLSYSFPKFIERISSAVDAFITSHPDIFDSSLGYFGDREKNVSDFFGDKGADHFVVDVEKFREIALCKEFQIWIESGNPISRRDFLIGLHKSYAQAWGQDTVQVKYILLHIHSYDGSHEQLLSDFPNLYLVAMCRDPREDWLSWDKVNVIRKGEFYDRFVRKTTRFLTISRYLDSTKSLFRYSLQLKPGRLIILDLNRFHQLNCEAMKLLADQFEIDYVDTLLKSTFLGKLWWGNSADKIPVSGFDPNKVRYKWQKKLSKSDEMLISTVLKEPIRILNYPVGTPSSDLKVNISWADLLNYLYIAGIKTILSRKKYNNRYLKYLPLFLAKSLHISYFVIKTTTRQNLNFALSAKKWEADVAELTGADFCSDCFLGGRDNSQPLITTRSIDTF
jgi:hypothetical protein